MPAVSEQKEHLRKLLFKAIEPFDKAGYRFYYSLIWNLLGLYLSKATLDEMTDLVVHLENVRGIKVIPEQEETDHD